MITDYSIFILGGRPQDGQTLDDVKDLLLVEVDKLKKGEFDEALLTAAINNYKLQETEALEDNKARTRMIVNSFTNAELFNIINSRLLYGKKTVISTNLSMEQFSQTYTDRLVSRVCNKYI